MQDGQNKRKMRSLTPEQLLKLRQHTALKKAPRDEGPLPLSFAQERLWFLSRMAGIGSAYHLTLSIRLRGELNTSALQNALDQLIARHEGLRAFVCEDAGEPGLRFAPPTCGMPLHLINIEAEDDLEAAIHQVVDEECTKPFDLKTGPLARCCLVRVSETEHVLLLVLHHFISDGWSNGLLLKELSENYTHLIETGQPIERNTPELAYADYAYWQKQPEQQKSFEKQKAYWEHRLSGAPERLLLPTDRKRPLQQSFEGAFLPLELDAELTEQVREFAREAGTTPYLVLMCAFAVVLARMSGQDDIVIGTPSANRVRKELEEMVGLFVNTLALRFNFDEDITVSQLLAHARDTFLDSQDNQSVPFEQVVDALNPQRSLSYTPLFQTMFAWQTLDDATLRFADLKHEPFSVPRSASQFDLTLELVDNGTKISGGLEYATALFDRQSIEQLAGYVLQVAQGICEDPEQGVANLPIIDDAARTETLKTSLLTSNSASAAEPIHLPFEATATSYGERIAIIDGEDELTYAQLNERANKLARYLRSLGVQKQDHIAICMQKSADAVTALLAVLKAGAAYIPIDASYPPERINTLVQDCSPKCILVDAYGAKQLVHLPDFTAEVVHIKNQEDKWGSLDGQNLTVPIDPDDLAYIIYTSGSTGRPKGVMVDHRAIWTVRDAWSELYRFDEPPRVLQMANLSFDVFTADLVRALTFGGTLVLVNQDELIDSAALLAKITQYQTTFADFVPAVLDSLTAHIRKSGATSTPLKTIVCGSDQWSSKGAAEARSVFGPDAQIIHAYGLTETAIDCLALTLPQTFSQTDNLSLGKAIKNYSVLVLDPSGQPVPKGVVGEICVTGAGLAQGYWNAPELTEQKFATVAGRDDLRFFKTGDLGRLLRDGSIEFLGRNDRQAKLRGFRIELGEVEATLETDERVQTAICVVNEKSGEEQLLAYVVLSSEDNGDVLAELKKGLSQKLPHFMVPAGIAAIQQIPLTPNGKVDHEALPDVDPTTLSQAEFAPPRAGKETELAQIWFDLLGLSNVGRHDNFFTLGGHSLLAVRLAQRIREVFSVDVAATIVFTAPTLATLARAIDWTSSSADTQITPADRTKELPLSSSQQRLWYLAEMEGQSEAYHMPLLLELKGKLEVSALSQAIETIVARHETLRTRFKQKDGTAYLDIRPANAWRMDVPTQLTEDDDLKEHVARLVAEPFDLEAGPLFRAALLHRDEAHHVLVIVMHHSISDAWSMGVFSKELSELYSALTQQQKPNLPDLQIQYADFAVWQREELSKGTWNEQKHYWGSKLEDSPLLLELPTDHARPKRQSFKGAAVPLELDASLSQKIKEYSAGSGGTVFSTLLGAWALTLSKLSGQTDLVVGSPVANRDHAQLNKLIGFFANTLALRVDANKDLLLSEYLSQVQETVLEAQQNQDLPFEQVIEHLNPPRSLAHAPLFQVMFAWEGENNDQFELPGLSVELLHHHYGGAKFDLLLSLQNVNGQLKGAIEFASDLFEPETAARIGRYFEYVLAQLVANTNAKLSDISLLTELEQTQALEAWQQRSVPYPELECISRQIEKHAAETPAATAVILGQETLSYGELNRQANQLAHTLRQQGIGAQANIALCVDRSMQMVVTLLGILKAGATVVPLDPAYPRARLQVILQDVQPDLIITTSTLRAKLPEEFAEAAATIEELKTSCQSVSADNLAHTPAPLDPAYILYTSGSTGKPKGVVQTHRMLRNLVHWQLKQGPTDKAPARVLQFASLNFDVAFQEVFCTLCQGSSLVLMTDTQRKDIGNLAGFIKSNGVERAHLPFAVLQQMAGLFESEHLPDGPACEVITAGEALLVNNGLRRLLKALGGRHFYNQYGPTETHVVTQHVLDCRHMEDWPASPPIGKPMDNTSVFLLDDGMRPVPSGTTGEIYVCGDNLASGYFGNEEMTADRFISHTFGSQPPLRLYRTGDLAAYLPDGTLAFNGRADDQVKFRGFRIEPMEITNCVLQLEGIQEAFVLFDKSTDAEHARLICYFVGTYSVDALRAELKSRLPDYMIPTDWMQLNELLITPNGKVDRRALPSPVRRTASDFEAPAAGLEAEIATIWEVVLKVDQIGRTDNFFDLGGHSLLATRLIHTLNKDLSLSLSLTDLIENPVLEDLAASAYSESNQPEQSVIQIHSDEANRYEPFPLTDIQQAYWVGRDDGLGLGGVSAHAYEEIEIPDLDLERFNTALNKLIQRHDMLRAVFAKDGTQRILQDVPDYIIQVDDARGRNARVVERMIARNREAMSHQVLDAGTWPLFEFRALQLDNGVTRLHISMDALIVDAASSQIFSRELAAFYEDLQVELPEIEITFRDYVVQELALRDGSRYATSLKYWQDRLATLAAAPDLPLAKQPESISNPRFTRRHLVLDAAKWSQIKANARQHGVTPSGCLLTAFTQVLAKWSQSPQFTLSLPVFNRQPLHPHINRLIGDFTSIVLLEVGFDATTNFVANAKSAQRQLWKDMDHSEVSGVRVLRELTKQRGEQQTGMPIVFNSTLVEMIPDQEEITLSSAMNAQNVHTITQTPQVWLDHTILEIDGELCFNWDSIDELFPEGMMQEMFEAYCALLEELVAPDRWQQTAKQTFPSWDADQALSQHWPLMHQLFDTQALKTPDAPALICDALTLSYSQTRQRARNLATLLQQKGLEKGELVAIKIRPGWEQTVAALAILYAGGAYLPIDPDLPANRIEGILRRTGSKLICVKAGQADKLKGVPDCALTINVGPELDAASDNNLKTANTQPDDLAYVIFTSGSTGEPKGVMIDHRGAVNTLLDINKRLNVQPEDRVFAISALGFDLSVYDIFGLLAAGGSVVIPNENEVKDPAHWLECLTQHNVTIWNSAPALLGMLIDYAESDRKSLGVALRQIMLSGDWIPLSLPSRARALASNAEVLSLGGATEASIWSICYPVQDVLPQWKSIPYGKSLENQQFYVLDEALAARPCWVPGELYIGGLGLAQGYWQDEEQTNYRFITHPTTGERLYRTGDLGRYMPDGNIEFLGRMDTQVKVQGFRIELGEIETVLNAHDAVKASVFKVFGDAQSDKQLVGYVVPERTGVDTDALLKHLRAHLPHYMIPSSLIEIEQIPVSANGKVDRQKLPRPSRSSTIQVSFEPKGKQEKKIREIVSDVLKLKQIAPEENLLQLGATSIDITRISNALSSELSFRPPLAKFMGSPSLATLLKMYREQFGQANAEVESTAASSAIATIEDPQERQTFKNRNVGLRRFDQQHTTHQLEHSNPRGFDEFDAYRSVRQFIPDPLPINRLEDLLSALRRNQTPDAPKHLFASAGGLYPVQTYIYIKPDRVQGLDGGAYYYDPQNHALISTANGKALSPDTYDYFVNRPTFEEAAFALFFVAERKAIEPLYGEMSDQFCLIETGAMAQLLTMRAHETGLGLCGIGSVDERALTDLFQLSSSHKLIYSMIGGTRTADQNRQHTIETFSTTPALTQQEEDEMEEFEI
ncbi:amino acid adenylation domain-containing protein [Pseudovibrio denitrificans]|uniref:non-ribosomal peptide synthetase n=1 Tax=Pseudovibrio denitrificans TaxID=258256 RepID=UPI0039BF1E80